MTQHNIKSFIIEFVQSKSQATPVQVDTSANLIESGMLDSIDFISLIMKLEEELGTDLDFSELDPTAFTSIDGLNQLLSSRENP